MAAERGTKGHKNQIFLPGNRHCLFGRAVRSYQITSRKHRLFFLNIKCRFFTAWNGQYVWRQREAPKDTQTKIFLPGNRHCLFRRAVRSYQRTLKHRLFLLNIQQCHFFTAWNGQYLWRQREAPKDTQPEIFLPGNRYCLFRRAVRSYQRTPKHRLFLLNIQCRFFTAWNRQYMWWQREAPKDTQTQIFLPGNRHCLSRRAVRSYQITPIH